jgi:glutathione S-transferase
MAQLRFVGRLVGLYPVDVLQQLEVDEIVETTQEVLNRAPQAKSPDRKRALREEYASTVMTRAFKLIDNRIATRGADAFAAGDTLSIADLCLVSLCSLVEHGNFEYVSPTFCHQFSAVTGLLSRLRVRHAALRLIDSGCLSVSASQCRWLSCN